MHIAVFLPFSYERTRTLNLDNWQTQLRKGLLDLVILNLLQHGRWHGYEMVQMLKKIDGLKIREGNIYPILARLQTDGLVSSRSEPSPDGPARKYFKLTSSGQQTLNDMNQHWHRIIVSINRINKGIQNEPGK